MEAGNSIKKTVGSFLAIAVCALVSSQAQGSLVVSALYNFTGSSLASADSDPNSTAGSIAATSLTAGSGIITTAGNPSPAYSFAATLPTTQTTASYLSFTVTAATGHAIDLATGSGKLTLALAASASSLGLNVAVRSSVDNFASNLAITGTGSGTITSTSFRTGTVAFTDLGSSYDSLSSVTFRIYAWSAAGSSGSLYADNITLKDTIITVPEPITYALPLFGLIFIGGKAGRFYLGWLRKTRFSEGRNRRLEGGILKSP